MPVAKVLHLRVTTLNLTKNLFLMLTILKEAYGGSPRSRAGFNDPSHFNNQPATNFGECAYYPPTSLILVKTIAFIKDQSERFAGEFNSYIAGSWLLHCETPSPHTRHPFWGCNPMRCNSKCFVNG